jgi:hypothetical protein
MNQPTRVSLTKISHNVKTGPIPVSMSGKDTCPDSCPLKSKGCYASSGHVNIHWSRLSKGERSYHWNDFLNDIKSLHRNQLWRHNQAGDLPGENEKVNETELSQLVDANKGRKGFTYTHKYTDASNHAAIKQANDNGFTINLSSNNVAHADELAKLNIGPVVTIVNSNQLTNTVTPEGRKVVICPATNRENVTCSSCGLCQRANRSIIIGFPAHGIQKKKVDAIIAA